jgi:O-antigen/teichoic acid export membrane protein
MSSGAELNKQVNRGIAWAGASQAIIAIADFVSQVVVLAFWISAGELGTMMAAMAFYPALDTAADLGVASSLIQKDHHTEAKISTVFWFNMMISAGLFLLLLGFGPLVGKIQGDAVIGTLISVYGIKLLLQNSYAIPFALLKKNLKFAEIAKLRTAAHLAESVGRIAYAALGFGVWTFLAAGLTRVVVFGGLMQLLHPWRPRFVFRPKEVKEYVRFGLRASASQVLYQLYTNLDYTVVRYFFGATANGIYTLAYTIVLEPVRMITNVVNDVAFPTFARLRHDRHLVADRFIKFTRLNLVAVLPFLMLIMLVVPDFLATFWRSSDWTPAQLSMVADGARILCFVGVLRALGFIGPPLLDGLGRPELTLRYMLVAAFVTTSGYVIGALTLGDALGPLSVAVAWAVFYPIAFALLAYVVAKTIALPKREYLRATVGLFGCAGAAWLAGAAVQLAMASTSPFLRLVASSSVALLVMTVLVDRWQGLSYRTMKTALDGK